MSPSAPGFPRRENGKEDAPVEVLGVPFLPLTYREAVERIRAMIATNAAHQVVLANANTVNLAGEDARYLQAIRNAALTLRDGVGVQLAAVLRGTRLPHNFVGTDFVPSMLSDLQDLEIGVFLYGAAQGVAEKAATALKRQCPNIRLLGTENGYGNRDLALKKISAARADILLVALGNPFQEQWIASNLDRLNARVAIGVGALFDYLAGRVPRAPSWVRRIRCEWLFRVCVEPKRLWRRYVLGNPLYMWRMVVASRREAR